MDTQNKLRQSTDAHRHISNFRWLNTEMLSVVHRDGAWRDHFCCSGCLLTL